MDFYQNFLLKTLGEKINRALPKNSQIDVTDVNAVMTNVSVLAEKVEKLEFGQPTGEYYTFLTKEVKIMIMRIISMTAALSSEAEWLFVTSKGYSPYPEEGKKNKRVLRVIANMYFDRNDNRPIASYQKIYELDRLFDPGVTYENASIEQKSNAEGLVRGIAETRCLSKFGIGEWFDNETDPERQLSDTDIKKARMNAPVIAVPTTAQPLASGNPEQSPEEIPFPVSFAFPAAVVNSHDESAMPVIDMIPGNDPTETPAKQRKTRKKALVKPDEEIQMAQ